MDDPRETAQADQAQAARHDQLKTLAIDSAFYRNQLLAQGFTNREALELVIAWQESRRDGDNE